MEISLLLEIFCDYFDVEISLTSAKHIRISIAILQYTLKFLRPPQIFFRACNATFKLRLIDKRFYKRQN